MCYQWYGYDHVVVGFSNGIVGLISASLDSLGNEVASIKVGISGAIDAMSVCFDQGKIAVAILGTIKFFSIDTK